MRRERGAFTVELALVLIVMIVIFYFMTDVSHKLLVRAKLDRASFALVNVLKERTRYFDESFTLTANDESEMRLIASRLLDADVDGVAIRVEALHNGTSADTNLFESEEFNNLGCNVPLLSTKENLVPVENGVPFSLYQVTLCENSSSWFARLLGIANLSEMTIASSSVMVGR
nr:tight adherence pilus pseudopilin TadF [Vibrio agarivorans]